MLIPIILSVPLLAALASVLVPRSQRNWLEWIASIAVVAELSAIVAETAQVVDHQSVSWLNVFAADALSALILLLIGIVGATATAYSIGYLRAEQRKEIIGFRRVRQYFTLLHLFLLAMFAAVLTTSPVVTWIAIEATTLSTAFLISFYNKPTSMEAAWKYLVINSVGLLFGFLGTLVLFSAVSQLGVATSDLSWHSLQSFAGVLNPTAIKVAFVLALVGYGTKAGLAPMHTWLPDAHGKAPAPISALLSGVLLNVAFLALLRFKIVTDAVLGTQFTSDLLVLFGALSIVIASGIILTQKNYKRLLAYSSVEHSGILALGFGFGGVATMAALLHAVYQSLIKSLLFFGAGNLLLKYHSTKIPNVRGALTLLPVTSVLFIGGVLALTGLPPFGLFLTKFSILSAGFAHYPWVVLLVTIALAVVFLGFLRHGSAMFFGSPPAETLRGETSRWTVLPLVVLALLIIGLSVVVPQPLLQLLTEAAALISGQ